MRVAIIGAGFCGIALAWHFLSHTSLFPKLHITVFDEKKIGGSISALSAGLLHPYSGARSKLNRDGLLGMQATEELLQIASKQLGTEVTAKKNIILRPCYLEQQETDFRICAQLYPQDTAWIDASTCQQLAPGSVCTGGLYIKTGYIVYPNLYLKGLWLACVQKGAEFVQQPILHTKELTGYDCMVFATGAYTTYLDEFSQLPLKQVKGQLLECLWPSNQPPLNCALNSSLYMVMTKNQSTCLVGATYEREDLSSQPNEETATALLLPKASLFFPQIVHMPIINIHSGLRSTTATRFPLIQRVSSSTWVLAGMGSKGLLYHSLYAKRLVEQVLYNTR